MKTKRFFQYTTSLSQNQVAIVRYHTSPTGTVVTFTSEASFDTYLYVIDPRLAAPISSSGSQPSTYNDDGAGNLQAKITKTLDGGVPYLVILCAYNPANSTGLCYLNFD